MNWGQVLSALGILGGLSGLGALALLPWQRRKLKVDAAQVIVDSAMDLLQPFRERVEQLEKDLTKVEQIVHDIRAELVSPFPSVERLRVIVGLPSRNGLG